MEEELEENPVSYKNKFHLAGIIPIATQPLNFNMPWHESLMPLAPNYLAFERSIYECAVAGCETIWIVSHRETTPLLRHRLGDWIYDPVINPSIRRKYSQRFNQQFKQIPIYYVPINPKDRDVRDGLVWSIFYGIRKAYHISRYFSKWVTPNKYYVSFPYSVYTAGILKEKRLDISSKQSHFLETPDGKTIRDGALAGFSLDTNEYIGYLKNFREHEKLLWKNGEWKNGKFIGEKLPTGERYTGRFIKPEQVFHTAPVTEENTIKLKWFNDISNWDGYCKFLGSGNKRLIKRPTFGFEYHEFNPIGVDNQIEVGTDEVDEEKDP
jgi:hypothetical protein